MKILTWNIRHGGSKKNLSDISQSLVQHAADILVITEFWSGEKGEELQSSLIKAGYTYQETSQTEHKQNGILIASKISITKRESFSNEVPAERWLEVDVPDYHFSLLGVHIPTNSSTLHNKKLYWDILKRYGKEKINEATIIIGDYNTGLEEDAEGTPFYCRQDMKDLLASGWVDCWRYTHGFFNQYTWFSRTGNGFRVDHACVSPVLKERILEAYFSHSERIKKISDHSVLIVELSMK